MGLQALSHVGKILLTVPHAFVETQVSGYVLYQSKG